MSSYPFGSDADLLPFFSAFAVEFTAGNETLLGILGTEYMDSDTGNVYTQQRVAEILIKTRDVGKISVGQSLQYAVPANLGGDAILRLGEPGDYDYVVRRFQPAYGGITTVFCNVMNKRA